MIRLSIPFIIFALSGCASQCPSQPQTDKTEPISYSLKITTPTAGWKLLPEAAYLADGAVLCIYRLEAPTGMVAQVISKVESAIPCEPHATPDTVLNFVLGKTWNWDSDPQVTFIKSLKDLESELKGAQKIDLPSQP